MRINFDLPVKKLAIVGAALTVVVGLSASSCDIDTPSQKAQQQGQQQTVDAFARQSGAVPYPSDQLRDSLERRNLKEKLLRYNRPDKISYVYLLSQTGGIYSYFTIKGKVSSNQSQMTTSQFELDHGSYGQAVVDAPGDDGSYGPDAEGIFFFTTDGVMVTWNGPYLQTDAPMKVNAQNLVLDYVQGSKPTSTGGK